MTVEGSCDARFRAVRDAFAALFADGRESGAAVAAAVDGRLVVDLWAGADAGGRPWARDTLVHTYSVSKPFAAFPLLRLVADGRAGLDERVVRYWPEYGVRGKETTTLRQLLSHQGGVVRWTPAQPVTALLEWGQAVSLCAAQAPEWPPGSAHGESLFLFGHLVGEVARRIDGRTPGRFIGAVLATRGVDFWIGVPESHLGRCAQLDFSSWDDALDGRAELYRLARESMPDTTRPEIVNSRAWRTAEVPAINGHGTARGIAQFYAALLWPGREPILDPALVAEAARGQMTGPDLVLGGEAAWGLGFRDFLDGSFGMGGLGGSVGVANRRGNYTYAYVTSRMGGHDRNDELERVLRTSLD